jgi:hypothetical protein
MAISTATALVGGAILGSAAIGASASKSAAQTQANAATQAADTEAAAAEAAAQRQAEAFRQAAAEQERGVTGAASVLAGAPTPASAPLTADTVNALYQEYLGRPAEPSTIRAWEATGGNAGNLMDALAQSEEFNLRLAQARSQPAVAPAPPGIRGGFEMQAVAAQQAAAEVARAQAEAARLQREQAERAFELQQQFLGPYREGGVNALARIQAGLAPGGEFAQRFTTEQFEADPGYAFRFSEGQKALERQAAARGGLISGSALRAATRFGQEMGSQEFQNAFNRFYAERQAQLNPLFDLYGGGLEAAGGLSSAAGTLGANVANFLGAGELGAGEARARGILGAGEARATGVLEDLQARAQAQRDLATIRASAYTGPAQFEAQGMLTAGQSRAAGLRGAGEAQAAGRLGVANALTNALGTGIGYYQQQQLLNRLSPMGGAGVPAINTTNAMRGNFPAFSFG